MTTSNGDYNISTDKSKLDIEVIHQFLSHTYWAEQVPLEVVKKSIAGSVCFGVYYKEQQVGFARMITDTATFAYLADVFIIESFRGRGLSKWLVETILSHPDLQGLRRIMLATKDAHGLYAKFGFTTIAMPDRWMNIHHPDIYKTKN